MIKPSFVRYVTLPQDHGSWVFLLSPLLIGLIAGGHWSFTSILLVIATLAAFLIRQPMAILVKAYSGRRPKSELPVARFWIIIYGSICLSALSGLVTVGYLFLLLLAAPGLLVLAWHLYLVSRRAERRQMGVEVVATGVLALAAPAGYWVGKGNPDANGWWLFGLCWFQSAASIVYAYLRLEQRVLESAPTTLRKLRMAWRAILYTTFNLVVVSMLSVNQTLPSWLPAPYALQWMETIWGSFNPAVCAKPASIGFRQLGVSTLFTILFILTWNI